jgi:H+-translocating NAD(P) transhydrogenase subunit beta
MPESFAAVAYLIAGVLFILSLAGLSAQESARRGNGFGIVGMALAVAVTVFSQNMHYAWLAAAVGVGAMIGAILAARVQMTSMPELVAALHSFVGLAAVLVGFGSYLMPGPVGSAQRFIHEIEVLVGVFVGAVTFTGSVVAFGKLRGIIRSRPLMIPGRHWLNGLLLATCVALGARFVGTSPTQGVQALAG